MPSCPIYFEVMPSHSSSSAAAPFSSPRLLLVSSAAAAFVLLAAVADGCFITNCPHGGRKRTGKRSQVGFFGEQQPIREVRKYAIRINWRPISHNATYLGIRILHV